MLFKTLSTLEQNHLQGDSTVDSGIRLTVEGKAVHGMDPSIGVNAGLYLLKFCIIKSLDNNAQAFCSI